MTTAVIHQPNYLPGLTYFDKLAQADIFVLLDNVQYAKRNWTNRNQIKTSSGAQWLTVPVLTKGKYTQTVAETLIDQEREWGKEHVRALQLNYSRALHFDGFSSSLFPCLERDCRQLADLNESLLLLLCEHLGIRTRFVRASELSCEGSGTELLANICIAVGANRYLSGPGGYRYMDLEVFRGREISVAFHEFEHPVYRQLHGDFLPGLSICDLIFNEGPASLDILRSRSSVSESSTVAAPV